MTVIHIQRNFKLLFLKTTNSVNYKMELFLFTHVQMINLNFQDVLFGFLFFELFQSPVLLSITMNLLYNLIQNMFL